MAEFKYIKIQERYIEEAKKHLPNVEDFKEFCYNLMMFLMQKETDFKRKKSEKYWNVTKIMYETILLAKQNGMKGAEVKANKEETLERVVSSAPSTKYKDNNNNKDNNNSKEAVLFDIEEKLILPWGDEDFLKAWNDWIEHKRTEHKFKYKRIKTEQFALNDLFKISQGQKEKAIEIIEKAISKNYKGLWPIKDFDTKILPEKTDRFSHNTSEVDNAKKLLKTLDDNETTR